MLATSILVISVAVTNAALSSFEASAVQTATVAATSGPRTQSLAFLSPAKWPSSLAPSSLLGNNIVHSANVARVPVTHSHPSLFYERASNDKTRIHSRRHTKLYAAIDDDNPQQADVIARLELNDQFSRWKLLQSLFEGELPASDIEDILILSLDAYLRHGPTSASADNKNENGGNASPVLKREQRSMMADLIHDMTSATDGIGDSRFIHMLVLPPVDYESITIDEEEEDEDQNGSSVEVDVGALSILERIERLLPDPIEDEEAHKSAWDVVIDLHGRESVRVSEEALQRDNAIMAIRVGVDDGGNGDSRTYCAEMLQWRTLCAVGRVLIHFDFLTKGILVEGTFRSI